MKALICSAGGSRGSYAGGLIEYYQNQGVKYDAFYGSSIGALIATLSAYDGGISYFKEKLLAIDNSKIFKTNPFKVTKQSNGIFKYSINHLKIGYNLIVNKMPTLGDSSLIFDLIKDIISKDVFYSIHNMNIKTYVTNLTLQELEIKKIQDWEYDDYCDWLAASMSGVPFMSIVTKNNFEYIDGGYLSIAPVRTALLDGADEIDIMMLNKFNEKETIEYTRNIMHLITRLINLTLDQNRTNDISLDRLAKYAFKDVKLNFHFSEKKLTNNALVFNPEEMTKWWEDGLEFRTIKKSYILTADKKYHLINE